jgi:hypothetical protein
MTKLISTVALMVAGLAALAIAGPALARLASALVTPILVVGVVVALLRWVWWYTR